MSEDRHVLTLTDKQIALSDLKALLDAIEADLSHVEFEVVTGGHDDPLEQRFVIVMHRTPEE